MAHQYQIRPTERERQAAYNAIIRPGGQRDYDESFALFCKDVDYEYIKRAEYSRFDQVVKSLMHMDPTKVLTLEQQKHLADTKPGILRPRPHGGYIYTPYYECGGKVVAVRLLQLLVNRKENYIVPTYDATGNDYTEHRNDVLDNWEKQNVAKEEKVDILHPAFMQWLAVQRIIGAPAHINIFGNFVFTSLGQGLTHKT